ncbi:hypothetical protein [Couchioplanes caeruleus]|uniref:Integral membrane protein n=2 Tax=Couchioplanes caeruleus TaxID=56438 RepID=A0A1K0GCP7_9ACTN|nr:hypothetical protein [Couchioplanes caeruleus]OJF15010.1 hypothetical protein BG844_06725 [Couchioplanes caeruleus subsp. caeruleus]ROP28919.1 hypothetical protein EDD30_1698 [Couchioplanes caeruleus]
MTTAGWVALGITVLGALSYGTASILQAVAARRSAGTVRTLGHPLYLLGIGCDVLAWVGSMVALRELAVYLVESILAGSLAVTVIAARIVLKSRLRRRDVAAVVLCIAALAVLALSAGPQHEVAPGDVRAWLCMAAVVLALAGWGAARYCPPGVVAALGGLCLGGAALTGRSLPAATDLLTEPLMPALLAFAVTGMMLYAHALQKGQVGPVTAVHWTAEVVAPSAVALVLLGDTVRSGWHLPAAVAGLVTIGAAVLLATAPATNAMALPPPTTTPQPARVPEAQRIIWWGPPPIWIPPSRALAALTAPPVRELATRTAPPVRELAGSRADPARPAWAPPVLHAGPWHDL